MNLKNHIKNLFKNISGWRTNRKLVIFSVDDYGNVRLASKSAFENLQNSNIPFKSIFDRLDTLETRTDLKKLFNVLTSVKDQYGKSAVFTTYALPCNIDFETMAENDFSEYSYEILPQTYEKLALKDSNAYEGAWGLWKEGIEQGLLKPQFHGREHFNLNIFNDLLNKRNENLLTVLKQYSYVSIPEHDNYSHGWTAAYSFQNIKETENYLANVADGLKCFKEVFGYSSEIFTPPAQQFPLHLEKELINLGLNYIDRPRSLHRHLGSGKYQLENHKLGGGDKIKEIVRNVVFEPIHDRGFNWVDYSFKQVEAAFRMRKPANISSHRLNFCGYIDPKSRELGLSALRELLHRIVKRWPDVEFISADELGKIITNYK